MWFKALLTSTITCKNLRFDTCVICHLNLCLKVLYEKVTWGNVKMLKIRAGRRQSYNHSLQSEIENKKSVYAIVH